MDEAFDLRDGYSERPRDLRSMIFEQLPGGIDPRPTDLASGSQPFDDR